VEIVEGLASWYGPGFEGRSTASGEPFDSGQLTAAHRSLPFGTMVEVTNLESGASVVVRINDRGPFEPTRIIDLSQAAAEAIGMLSAGVASVSIAPLTTGVDALKLAVATDLRGYEARSTRFLPGQLLVLEGAGEAVLIRVVAGEAGFGADLFVSAELFAALGPITQARQR
jgi:rare lipoprotein A